MYTTTYIITYMCAKTVLLFYFCFILMDLESSVSVIKIKTILGYILIINIKYIHNKKVNLLNPNLN